MKYEDLLCPSPAGLYCKPGDRAVVTHGHADHARSGHARVLATRETLAIMGERYGEDFAGATQPLGYHQKADINGVTVSLAPAGHVLGSAQAVVKWKGMTM